MDSADLESVINVCASNWIAPTGANPDALRAALEAENIESRPVWTPLYMQPLLADCETIGGQFAETRYAGSLCLPLGSNLLPENIDQVCAIIRAQVR